MWSAFDCVIVTKELQVLDLVELMMLEEADFSYFERKSNVSEPATYASDSMPKSYVLLDWNKMGCINMQLVMSLFFSQVQG
mmetsp:Transcript_1108/g.1796  ORF Transcript_1108/g.1796 Transcript_1108/m.1796 type:complete len:81 (+) Transcript_1108:110-352(+)